MRLNQLTYENTALNIFYLNIKCHLLLIVLWNKYKTINFKEASIRDATTISSL